MQGAFFIVVATSPTQQRVTVTAVNYRALISVGDTLAGYTNASQFLGSVSTPSTEARAACLQRAGCC